MGFLDKLGLGKLKEGLSKTREGLIGTVTRILTGAPKIDEELFERLEESLIAADVGAGTSAEIMNGLRRRIKETPPEDASGILPLLQQEVASQLLSTDGKNAEPPFTLPAERPYVILVVGINGVGKTTTIGKLAWNFKQGGKSVLLGAADTFRAAAIDQLQIWADRVQVPIVKQKMGADPASVAFDTLKSAKAAGTDVVIIDTAGRLHNKINLMNELTKIRNVMQKVIVDAPHEVLLILDGSTGQNAFEQAKQFTLATDVTALALTKLDGTAKGGVVIGISDQFKIPVKFIGIGEKMSDLQIFDRREFVNSLFS